MPTRHKARELEVVIMVGSENDPQLKGKGTTKRLVIGISGASGAIYGIRSLEVLQRIPDVETHLVITKAAELIIPEETDRKVDDVKALANVVYQSNEMEAAIASGSFVTMGLLVAPCSVKTLSAIANSFSSNLLSRTADVHLKERRPVVLLLRETPLHRGHLRLMQQAAENGALIMPPVPIFYNRPKTLDDIIDSIVGRALQQLGIDTTLRYEWSGIKGLRQKNEG